MASMVESIPAPVGGWDVKSALADMPEQNASTLDNWFPGEGRVSVRPGYSAYATGLEGDVETLAEFINGSNRKLLAFANNKIWNISAAGAATDITNNDYLTGSITAFADGGGGQVVVTSAQHGLTASDEVVITGTTNYNGTFTATNLTSDTYEITDTWVSDDATGTWTHNSPLTITSNQWDWACMDGKMGLVNGADVPLEIATDGITPSPMTVSGPTIANLIGLNVFKGRSYFWEDDSQDFWYSAVNTLGGALTQFPLSRVGQFGGKLLAMGTWTLDGGAGVDDFAAFFMTSGETIIYQGSDPSTFSLVGVFSLGSPVSQRGVIKLGGDLVVITSDGYISLNGALKQGRVSDRGILSDQINPAVTDAVTDYGGFFGWQAFHYPRGNMVIFNVPITTNTTYQQHVFNTNTGRPCRFKNIHARCWGLYNDKAYIGGDGAVYLFGEDFDDLGGNIDADAVTAPTYLKSKRRQKHVQGLQVVTASDGVVGLSTAVAGDFKIPSAAYTTPTFVGGSSSWDTAVWDTAPWSGDGANILKDWITRNAFGYSVSTRVRVRTKGQLVKWYSVNYMFSPAGLT